MSLGVTVSASDLESQFGALNIQNWSDLDGTGSTDTARVTAAITYASQEAEDKLRGGPYTLPLSGSASALNGIKEIVIWLAGARLYFARGLRDTEQTDKFETQERRAHRRLDLIKNGSIRIVAAYADTMPTAPVVV